MANFLYLTALLKAKCNSKTFLKTHEQKNHKQTKKKPSTLINFYSFFAMFQELA